MVEPCATTLGGLTVAVSADRFLLEDAVSNSILSLHPAVTIAGERDPRPCRMVEGVSQGPDHVEVTWQAVGGLRATTTLSAGQSPLHLQLQFQVANLGPGPVAVEALHPLYFPPEGPGACALGLEDLRTLAASKPEGEVRLMRLHGPALHSALYGVWFSPAGRSMLLLAALDAGNAQPQFLSSGARGKMLSLRVDCPCRPPRLAPGETAEAVELLLAIGNLDVGKELEAWARTAGDAAAAGIPDFEPSDEIVEPEPEAEPEEAAEEETGAGEESLGEEESVSPADAGGEKEEKPPGAAGLEPADQAGQTKEAGRRAGRLLAGRCAFFQRAQRATRGFLENRQPTWPRWASGRRCEPVCGASSRTRGYWRAEYPVEDS